jgi:hypothetical protein
VDLILRGGRVVDPESGLDAVRDVAVSGGRVAEIGNSLAPGAAEVDVGGLVVTAGFIDLHSHVNTVAGLWLQAADGVTTALELEAGVTPVSAAYRMAAAEGRPVNYGFAASWAMARMEAVAGIEPEANLSAFLANMASPGWQRPAAPGQIAALLGGSRPTWPTGHWASACSSGTPRPAARTNTCRSAGWPPRRGCPPSRTRGT